tara:strand:- start:192 stop:569 length:378 start_codon:yes stop_codon:yes gene_type:complete
MKTYNAQVERDIKMVFDNDYAAYKKIAHAATFFACRFEKYPDPHGKIGELADFIADMYYDRINAAADLIQEKRPQTVNNNISAMLVREVCLGLPTDVFRNLAVEYMASHLEQMEYMKSTSSEGGQ